MSIPPCSRLLILACSATKRNDAGHIPAIERYDGPLWRTLRHCDPEGRKARVAFLSARYGFRDALSAIENYDARMTEDVADRMIAGGIGMRWLGDIAPQLLVREDRRRLSAAKARAGRRVELERRISPAMLYVRGWPTRMLTDDEAETLASVRRGMTDLFGFRSRSLDRGSIHARYAELLDERARRGVRIHA